MKNNNKVSIIIPVYNCEKYIKKCIESLLNQTYKDIEIVIVNDGSIDNSLQICKEYEQLSNIRIYSKQNGGVSSARNYGIEKASGKYIIFIDSDDYIDIECVEKLVKNNVFNSLICLNYCKYINNKKIVTSYGQYNRSEFISGVLKGNIHGGICGILFEKEKIGSIRFDNNTFFMEDTIFLFNYINRVDRIKFVDNNCFYYYVENVSSITKSKGHSIAKISSICYSLKNIDEMFNYDYHELIQNKLVILVEKEMRNCKNTKDMNEIYNLTSVLEYNGNNSRIKTFTKLYNSKRWRLLKHYYIVRNISKNLYYFLKK